MSPLRLCRQTSALVGLALVATAACQPAAPVVAPVPGATPASATPVSATGTSPTTGAVSATPSAGTSTSVQGAPTATDPSASTTSAQARSVSKPTATPPPFLTHSSLATLPADQARAASDARLALAGGDFDRAEALLQPLLAALPGDPRLEIQLMYGQAQVGAHQFDAAIATAQSILDATSRADLVSAARLMRGQALRGLGRFDDAAAEMRAVADTNPLVAPAVRLELEDMWLAAGQPDQAASDGQKGLDTAQARLLTIDLAEKLATADVQLHQTDAAMDAYRQLLTAAGSKSYLGEQLYNLAEGATQLGRTDDAINALRTSIEQFPRSRKAPEAVDLLEKLGGMRPEDRFYVGVIRYLFWNFRGARADFDAYLQALPDGDRAIDARYYRGLSSPANDTTTLLLQLADDVPNDDFAPMALLEAGKAQEELSNYGTAEQIYARLVATYPTRDAGLAGAFRRGLALYMQGDPKVALAAWNELLARDPPPEVRSETLYWSGKALAATGDAAAATEHYRAAAAVRPVDYYVMRATVALDPPPSSASFDPTTIWPSDEAELAKWFAGHGLDLAAAAQVAGQDPSFLRAQAMVQHGLYKQANWEYEIFLTTYADKPDRLYWLASRFGEMGLPNAALKLGTAALDAATAEGQVSTLDVPRALARAASPLAFPDLVTSTANARGIDPLLFMSLMRQESDFDPYVESVANAKGLTQIVPQTGAEIARALGVKDFQSDDLYQPKRNVQFGAYYFGQRLKRNGQTARALASYNAGDGNVDTWTLPGRDDPDVFIEYVPFQETHDYVKKIQTFWWTYRYLWAR